MHQYSRSEEKLLKSVLNNSVQLTINLHSESDPSVAITSISNAATLKSQPFYEQIHGKPQQLFFAVCTSISTSTFMHLSKTRHVPPHHPRDEF